MAEWIRFELNGYALFRLLYVTLRFLHFVFLRVPASLLVFLYVIVSINVVLFYFVIFSDRRKSLISFFFFFRVLNWTVVRKDILYNAACQLSSIFGRATVLAQWFWSAIS